jgi:hypothetical protein
MVSCDPLLSLSSNFALFPSLTWCQLPGLARLAGQNRQYPVSRELFGSQIS